MRKISKDGARWLAVFGALLWVAAPVSAAAQDLTVATRTPRFLMASRSAAPPVEIDVRTNELLRRRVSLRVTSASLRSVLRALSAQAGVKFVFDPDAVPASQSVTLRAEGITLASALLEVLLDTDLDVLLLPTGRQLALIKRAGSRRNFHTGGLTGRVTDAKGGAAVPNAEVLLSGTRWHTATDTAGRYRLAEIEPGRYTLVVRRIGYAKHDTVVVVAEREDTVNVALEPLATRLDELVTTATGQQRRRDVNNSITTIEADSVLRAAPIKNVTDLLETRVSGLTAQHTSGAPGDPTKLRLRGIGSVTRNNDPVVVVDGQRVYAVQSDARSGNLTNFDPGVRGSAGTHQRVNPVDLPAPSPLDQIDPNIIEKIEVFKGPSAATLYGPDAANGVIVITTKRGKPGPTRWNASFTHSRTGARGRYPTAYFRWGHAYSNNAQIFCPLTNSVCVQDSLVQFQALNDPSLTILGHGYGNSLSLTAGGGTQVLTYSITGSYNNDVGHLALPDYEVERFRTTFNREPPDWMRRPHDYKTWTVSSNVTATLSPTADVTLFASLGRSQQQRTQLENQLSALAGTYVDTVNGIYYRPFTSTFTSIPVTIYALQSTSAILKDYYIRVIDDALNVTTQLSGNWRPRSWLSTYGQAGLNLINRDDPLLLPAGLVSPVDSGSVVHGTGRTITSTFNLRGELRKPLGAGFVFTTNVGASLTATHINDLIGSASGLVPGTSSLAGASRISATEMASNTSIFDWSIEPRVSGRTISLSAGFLLSGGSNGGTRIQNSNGLGGLLALPRLGGSWVISDQSWFPFRSVVSSLRLRGTYGQSSVQLRPTEHLRLYTDSAVGGESRLLLSTLGNTKLRPERSTEFEGGFEASMLDDRLSVDMTFYRKLQLDAVMPVQLPPSVKGGGTVATNIGNVLNRGVELTVGVTPVRTSMLTWNLELLYSHNTNVLSKLGSGVLASARQGLVEGYPIGGRWARPIIGYADQNGDGVLQPQEIQVGDSLTFMGRLQPPSTSALHSNLRLFNAIQVTATFSYDAGATQVDETARTNWVLARALVDASVPLDQQAAVLASTRAVNPTDYGLIYDVSTFRFNSLSVNYQMPSRISRLFRARTMGVALQGSNLALHSTYGGRDPNVSAWSPGEAIMDTGQLALPRLWQLRVDLQF